MKRIIPYLISFLFTIGCFLIHMSENSDSMLNNKSHVISNQDLQSVIDFHKSSSTFSKRPFTTFLIEKTSDLFQLKIGESFIIINFFFLFLSGCLLYFLSFKLTNKRNTSLFNLIIYFLCFSTVFAFFPPIYTYDDPLQFCLILSSIILLIEKKWFLYIITFSLSLITRESGLILIPGLIILFFNTEIKKKGFLKKDALIKLIFLILPVIIYLIYLTIFLYYHHTIIESSKSIFLNRFHHVKQNFQNLTFTIETLISLFIILGIPIYLLINRINRDKKVEESNKKYIQAFLLTALINSIIVITSAKAREVRLFAIPLLYIWPIFSNIFYEDIKAFFTIKNYIHLFSNISNCILFILLNSINYFISFEYYITTIGDRKYNLFSEYLFLYILIIIIHFLFKMSIRRELSSEIDPLKIKTL